MSPKYGQSGIWQSDTGPAADDSGTVYVATGNGAFDANSGGRDYGDSLLKLTLKDPSFAVRDRFTPSDPKRLADEDLDLGSGGPVLVPPHFVAIGGKDGVLYLLDRNRLGGKPSAITAGGGIYSAPAFWNDRVRIPGHVNNDSGGM